MFNNSAEYLGKICDEVNHIKVHDHTCSLYETPEEQFSVITPFIRQGLLDNAKCIYVADENPVGEVIKRLSSAIPDIESYIAKGALVLLDKSKAYLEHGYFSPELMIEAIKILVSESKQQGYGNLRITGEMTWALSGEPGAERLMEYESRVNHLYESLDAMAICQYNISLFSPETIKHLLLTHPVIIYKGNFCRNFNYVTPEEYLRENDRYAEVNRTLEQILDVERREKALVEKNTELKDVNNRLNEEILMRKKTEEVLLKTLDELERSNQELQQFAYVASHDLQEPIRMISVYTRLLEKQFREKLDDRTSEFMFFIMDGAKRMHTLIQDLLAFSRVASRKDPFSPTDLNVVIADIMRDLQVTIADHNAIIEFDRLPVVIADPTQMRQLFQNLIQNAIKFRSNNAPVIRIEAEQDSGEYFFRVIDNGIGIEKDYHEKIFIIFQRLHDREEYPGTGIGLAICNKIVERHRGRIWVESEPGRGSAFCFTLKLNPED